MAVTGQSGIGERLIRQEYQSQKMLVILNWAFGLLVATLLAVSDLGTGLRWGGVHALISLVPTVLLIRRAQTGIIGFVLPVALAAMLCSLTFLAGESLPFWVPIFAAVCVSICTRDRRAPAPVMLLVLATIFYHLYFGSEALAAQIRHGLTLNLVLLVVAGTVLLLVGVRIHRIQMILQDAAGQEETMQKLDAAMAGMTEAGGAVAQAAASLDGAARQAAGGVAQLLVPAVGELDSAGRRLDGAQRATAEGAARLVEAADGLAAAMQSQAEQVAEAAHVAERVAGATTAAASDAARVAEAAAAGSRQASEGGKVTGEVLGVVGTVRESLTAAAGQMNDLARRSAQISEVVSTISSIAEQTNMLALNAAIEAARAGEAGRGFAVVADEIRKLSQHSAKATEQIAGLIAAVQTSTDTAVAAVTRGAQDASRAADQTGAVSRALEDILAAVGRTAEVARGIEARTQQAAEGAKQLSVLTQSLTAIAEETAASAEEMTRVSGQVAEGTQEAGAASAVVAAASRQVAEAVAQIDAAVRTTTEGSAGLQRLAADLAARQE
ncbi:MAG TPA: methyl-accepting chemotaxis protein [Symbiobacteriaceae bacterium]|nr:methyl-accepting chemotaxis protein [Symbiobacteriaceae bacterium]